MSKKILEFWDDVNFNGLGLGIAKFNNKFGIINYDMEILVPLKWKSIEIVFTRDYKITNFAIAKKGDFRAYLIDYQKNIVLSKEYKEIKIVLHDAFIYDDREGRKKVLTFEGIEYIGEEADIFLNSAKKYEAITDNSGDYKQIYKISQNDKYALSSEQGEPLTRFVFDDIQDWKREETLIYAAIEEKYFFIDNQGFVLLKNLSKSNMLLSDQVETPIQWENVLHFKAIQSLVGATFKVQIGDFWHILLPDFTISEVAWKVESSDFRSNYYPNFYFQKGFPFISRNTFEEAIIDINGNFVKQWYFRGYRIMSNGLVVVRRVGLIGLFWSIDNRIEKRKHWIDIKNFDAQHIIVKLGKNQFIFVDEKGEEKNNFIFQDIKKAAENQIIVKQNDKWEKY
jgi:hypothetical protein